MFRPDRMFTRWAHDVLLDEAGDGSGGGGVDVAAEATKKLAFERDQERAKAAKLAKELDEIRKALPTDEQKARWAELEKTAETAEEERKRKAGEFDGWRQQIAEKHTKDLALREARIAEAEGKASKIEADLQGTLIGLAFAGAADLFGPSGKTVLMPDVAKAYFAQHVAIDTDPQTGKRSIVVKDAHGTVLVDPKTGAPLEFGRAMKELIDAHPDKDHLLRGSGKSGSGSPGGTHGTGTVDLSRLSVKDFADPKIREAVKRQHAGSGGLQIGPAFDRRGAK